MSDMPTVYLREKGTQLSNEVARLNSLDKAFIDVDHRTVEAIRQLAVAILAEIDTWRDPT